MNPIINSLKQPSTWAGLSGIIVATSHCLPVSGSIMDVITAISALFSALAVCLNEKSNPPKQP